VQEIEKKGRRVLELEKTGCSVRARKDRTQSVGARKQDAVRARERQDAERGI
jgi:hypothetical protein